VAEGVNGDTGGKVEVFAALGVPDVDALARLEDKRGAGVDA
jgi:hypothetical protein